MQKILVLGVLFGLIIQYANLNKFNLISALAMRKDYSVAKALLLAIGIGITLINLEIAFSLANYHIKPFIVGGIILGGILFGIGMAILGYCPGTLAISAGQGSLDAIIGIIGGLLGAYIYTLSIPFLKPILGPDLGKLSFYSLITNKILFIILMYLIALFFIVIAIKLDNIDKIKDKRWILSGILLAVLNAIVFLKPVSNRPIGASTTYPYVANLIFNNLDNTYFHKIKIPGHWELIFLIGAFLSALIVSIFIRKDFNFTLIHENWKKFKSNSIIDRIAWSFLGGFILIFGARMAGGCTSGHILSGSMQLAISSLVFALFVFASLLVTGKFFYKS